MTPEEIDGLPAGLELDALISVRVMGFEEKTVGNIVCGDGGTWALANARRAYSTDIAAAWEILRIPLACQPIVERTNKIAEEWECDFGFTTQREPNGCAQCTHASAKAPTAPLAICRAALKAIS